MLGVEPEVIATLLGEQYKGKAKLIQPNLDAFMMGLHHGQEYLGDVLVKAREPFQPAPITMPIEASSSSACTIANLFFFVAGSTRSRLQWRVNASASEEEGVIGYQAHTVAPP